jgi:hypothetical protein
MIDPLNIWKNEYEKIPNNLPPPAGSIQISSFINLRVTAKLETNSVTLLPPPTYTWMMPTFQGLLSAIAAPSPDASIPIMMLANAWASAALSSQLIITPGTQMNPPAPPTTGIISTAVAVIDPPSVALAQQKIVQGLLSAPPASKPSDSKFPEVFREAFTMLTFTLTGLDSTPPPAGPLPFVMPMVSVK